MARMTENELLAEIAQALTPELDETCEVCTSMILQQFPGSTVDTVRRLLTMKEKRGELVSRFAMYNGERVKAYRKVA